LFGDKTCKLVGTVQIAAPRLRVQVVNSNHDQRRNFPGRNQVIQSNLLQVEAAVESNEQPRTTGILRVDGGRVNAQRVFSMESSAVELLPGHAAGWGAGALFNPRLRWSMGQLNIGTPGAGAGVQRVFSWWIVFQCLRDGLHLHWYGLRPVN